MRIILSVDSPDDASRWKAIFTGGGDMRCVHDGFTSWRAEVRRDFACSAVKFYADAIAYGSTLTVIIFYAGSVRHDLLSSEMLAYQSSRQHGQWLRALRPYPMALQEAGAMLCRR